MPVRVKVKWPNGKTTLEGVELNKTDAPAVFKAQLMSMTGVPVDRQKIMFKGKVIPDDSWPDNLDIPEESMFMLMGSSEKLPDAPIEKPKFVEDMNESELAVAMDLPTGLTNLGNTCYMSATVQCLKTVPELSEALKKFEGHLSLLATLSDEPDNQGLTIALRDLYGVMKTSSVCEPTTLLRMLHRTIPRFAQRGEGNVFQQQDANECWTELTRILQQNLKPMNQDSKYSNFVDQYFSGTFEAEMKCDEAPEEAVSKSEENFLQLSCFISQDVRYMQAGLTSRMKETITKLSPTLNRDASYTKTSRISRLPAYLTIQFVRFHYKGNVQTNAKLLRDVKFSMILDVYELCTKELQEKLAPMRLKYKKADDLAAVRKSELPDAAAAGATNLGTNNSEQQQVVGTSNAAAPAAGASSSGEPIIISGQNRDAALKAARAKFMANDEEEMKKYTFADDPGSNNSGFYDLKAVLTHKGRSSSSGHYVAWIKREDQWFKCDDDLVEPVDSEDILKLSGGGDWHCAYVCLYAPRFLNLLSSEDVE